MHILGTHRVFYPITDVPRSPASHYTIEATQCCGMAFRRMVHLSCGLTNCWRPAGEAAAGEEELTAEDDEEEEEEDAEGSSGLPIKLSSNRRADVSEFKGKRLVNIREYYEVMPIFSAVSVSSVCL